MFSTVHGQVIEVIKDLPGLQELIVEVNGSPERAYNYPDLNHRLTAGEKVTLNTSAVKLGLGTGGRHFVVPEYRSDYEPGFSGHIMKLRYTPWQFPILAAEEEESPYHQQIKESVSLNGIPVVIAPLHSMLPGVCMGFHSRIGKTPRIAYIMTDGAALPIALSELVRELKSKRLLDLTVTSGHAFGGDLEAVSIPSALLAAYHGLKPDMIIVALGPGIVGTGTSLGFSGIEQSWIIDLVAKLNGKPVVVPRVSNADQRERHFGISHHSMTILDFANHSAFLGISSLIPQSFTAFMIQKIIQNGLLERHQWLMIDDLPAEELFAKYQMKVKTMGRNIKEDPYFFQSTVSAGVLAAMVALDQMSSLKRI